MFSSNYLLKVARRIHVKNNDWQIVFLAEGKGRAVHYFKPFLKDISKTDGLKLDSIFVFFRVSIIDTIYAGAF